MAFVVSGWWSSAAKEPARSSFQEKADAAQKAKPEKKEKVDLNKGLELWLPLNNGFRDHSKNRHVGEVNGNLSSRADGAHFDGQGDYIVFPEMPVSESSFALSTWILVRGHFSNYGIVQQKNANRKLEWMHLMLRDRMNPFFSFYMANTQGETRLMKTSGWRHLVVQYDRDKGRAEIYVDGRLDGAKKQPMLRGSGGKFIIGLTPEWGNVPARDFEGTLWEFRVYSCALNQSEIKYLASMSSAG